MKWRRSVETNHELRQWRANKKATSNSKKKKFDTLIGVYFHAHLQFVAEVKILTSKLNISQIFGVTVTEKNKNSSRALIVFRLISISFEVYIFIFRFDL